MYQNKLLCFKTCYCLGVADVDLESDFPQLYGIAKSIGYFDTLKVTRTYRALTKIFYTVARHSILYTPDKTFAAVAGNRFKSYLEGTDLTPDVIYQDAENVRDFLNKLVEKSHIMLPAVYAELKPALDYLSFETIMRLEPLSDGDVQKLFHILRRIPVKYNIYFFADDLFNITMRDMLRTDVSLRKCISMVTGRPLDKSSDTSDLAKELDKRDDGYYVSPGGLAARYKALYILQSNLAVDEQASVLSMFADNPIPINVSADTEAFLKLWDDDKVPKEEIALVARLTDEELTSIREHCGKLDIALLIPVTRSLYKRVLSGQFENVALLPLR